MKIFLDTSALVKFYHEEEGTASVTALILDCKDAICISELAKLEIISSFCRRFRNKEIDKDAYQEALEAFREDLQRYKLLPVSYLVLKKAEMILLDLTPTIGLRTLDVLHLATFTLESSADSLFVAGDKALLQAAEAIGANTYYPSEIIAAVDRTNDALPKSGSKNFLISQSYRKKRSSENYLS